MNRSLTSIVLFLALTVACPSAVFASEFAMNVPLYGSAAYYVPARFGGVTSGELMVDTGSGYMSINEQTLALLKQNGDAEYVKRVSGILADGSQKTVPVYRLRTVSIGCCCVVRDVEAAVFPGTKRQILGLSALKTLAPFTISTEPPQLTLSHCREDTSTRTAVGLSDF